MFKRFLCCTLICALLAAATPTVALAGDSVDALEKLRGMRYIDKLCAVNANAPDWHAGMSLAHANSLQMETALQSLLDEKIIPALEYLEQTVRAQIMTETTNELSEKVRKARNDCRALRDAVQAELDIITYERGSLPDSVDAVFNGTYVTANQAEAAAQRALLGVQRLENGMSVVSGDYSEWESEAKRLFTYVFPDDERIPSKVIPKSSLETHVVGVRADYMNLMMEEARRITAEEKRFSAGVSNGEGEVEIYAVPRDKILLDVRDGDTPVANANVIARNVKTGERFSGTYDADAEGYLFSAKSLGLESDGYLEIGYEVKCSGYESRFVNSYLCEGGDIFRIALKRSGSDPYISGASFNGEDMQWNQTRVYITDANDANQTISVYLDQASAMPSGTVNMFYTDRDGTPKSCSATAVRGSDGRVHADFVGEWCRIFQIGAPVSFSVDRSNADPIQSSLATIEPAVNVEGANEPRFETDNTSLLKRFLPSDNLLRVTFPEDIPFFGGSIVSLNFPGEQMPVTVYAGLDGTFLILLSRNKKFGDFLNSKVAGDAWKAASQAQNDRAVSNAVEEVEEEIKSTESSFVKDEKSVSKPFLGKYKAWWALFFCAQGKIESEGGGAPTVTGQVSAGFNIGLKADFAKQLLATPPLKFNVGFTVGVGAMINGLYRGDLVDCLTFQIWKLDLDFGAVSILIPTSVYVSLGVGVELLNAGVKAAVSVNLALPIITDEYRDNVTVALDARVTIYGQLLFLHVDWLIARVSWSYENGHSGQVNGYVIGIGHLPKNSASSSGFEMPDATPPETGFRFANEPVLGESGTSTSSLDVDTNVVWTYETASVNGSKSVRTSSTLPKKFEMYNGNSVDMAVWAEDNRIMISANGLENAQELKIPDDPDGDYTPLALAKKGIESGAYKIIDVNANGGDCHYDKVGSFQMPVQVAVLSVTYAKSFKTETQTTGGKTVEVTVPKEVETLSMAMVLTMYSTTPLILSTDAGKPAAYVFLNTTDAVREYYPYPCQIHLKENPKQAGQPCIDTANSFGVVTGALFKDGSLASAYYYFKGDTYEEDYSWSTFRILKTGTAQDVPVYIGVDVDGTIVSGPFSNVVNEDYADFADGEDIEDFVLFGIADTAGEMAAFYLEKTAQEGMNALKAVPMKVDVLPAKAYDAEFKWMSSEIWDYETDIPSTAMNLDKLINYRTLNGTLYWFDTGLKRIGASDEKKEIARVRGVYFDWFHRKASKPFTIATLDGNDGDTGGLIPNLAPLTSFESGGQFYFARALEKENREGEGDSYEWQQGPYLIYKAPISNVVNMRVVSASSEYHAMTAGRSGNFTFTLLNDGNMPISSATMRVSRILKGSDGEEIKETVAEYVLKPSDESANQARFWSVNAAEPDVRSGRAAVRQLDTIFDSIPGDPLASVEASNENPYALQSFLPESVLAYKSTIAIPEDWDGLQLLRAEIVNAYGPIQLAVQDAETRYAMYDLQSGAVYAADANGNTVGAPLLTAGGIPLRVEKSKPYDLIVDTAEISLSGKLHEKNGEKYISATITQTGNTAMNRSTGNITLRAYIDDETDYPTFIHTFKNHTTGDIALNMDAPVSVLTGGRKADKLTLIVTDEADGNVDLSLLNNYREFYLNEGLKWSLQPTDQTVPTGGTAIFTACAGGGAAPYTYRWLRMSDGQSVEVGTGDTLTLENCIETMNGGVYCCVATDAAGQTITSMPVRLWVQRIVPPPTGDASRLPLWSALLAASAIALLLIFLARRRAFVRRK